LRSRISNPVPNRLDSLLRPWGMKNSRRALGANDVGIIALLGLDEALITKADEFDPADPELHRAGSGVRWTGRGTSHITDSNDTRERWLPTIDADG